MSDFPGPRSSQEVFALLRAMGEPLKVPPTRTTNPRPSQRSHQREGDEGAELFNLDRLAAFVCGRVAAREVPIHPAVHLSLRLLHGSIVEEGPVRVSAGKR